MEYKFTPEKENYEMYASGGVFYAQPKHPAFPVRLSNEIFRRCRAFLGVSTPCHLYDPCCGSAYHLAVMAYFNWDNIASISASDIDSDTLIVAKRNLSLLELGGLDRRIGEITNLYEQFGKESHASALHHATLLKNQLTEFHAIHPIQTHLFHADATDSTAIQQEWDDNKVDMVITDIPYGWHSEWHPESLALTTKTDPIQNLLEALLPILQPHAVVAIAAGKQDKIRHARYTRLDKMSIGKRQVVILRPIF